MAHRRHSMILLSLSCLVLNSCDDSELITRPIPDAPRNTMSSTGPVPARADDWRTRGAGTIWEYVLRADSTVTIGVKSPGAARGIFRGRRLVSDSTWKGAREVLEHNPRVRVVDVGEYLPILRIKVSSAEAMAWLSTLPFVDYVEPAIYLNPYYTASGERPPFTAPSLLSSCATSDGSSSSPINGDRDLDGDAYPFVYDAMRISQAWAYATGEGAKVALIDTGIDLQNEQLSNIAAFDVDPDGIGYDYNSHGTHQMGALAAPRDGRHVVGIAHGATAISVRHGNGYTHVDSWKLNTALDIAVRGQRAKVVNMALRANNTLNMVADNIAALYYDSNYDPLFVAAAGTTCPEGFPNVAFPAELPEVIAVSGLELYTENKLSESWWGSDLDLSAPVGQRTTGHIWKEGEWGTTGGASSASVLVSGVATLVRSRYPAMRNYQVRDHLIWAAKDVIHYGAGWDSHTGWGIVDANKAVGGFYKLYISGPGVVEMSSEPYEITLTAHTYGGTGPFSYSWSDGPTTPSRTITITPEQCNYDIELNLTVTDHFNGRQIPLKRMIHVSGATYCPNDDGTIR